MQLFQSGKDKIVNSHRQLVLNSVPASSALSSILVVKELRVKRAWALGHKLELTLNKAKAPSLNCWLSQNFIKAHRGSIIRRLNLGTKQENPRSTQALRDYG